MIGPFKLTKLAGAIGGKFKKCDASKNYSTVWANEKIKKVSWRLEEAEKKRSRKLGEKWISFIFKKKHSDPFFGIQGWTLYKNNGGYWRKIGKSRLLWGQHSAISW